MNSRKLNIERTTELRKQIGTAVLSIRQQKGVTQESVCKKARVARNRIINIEDGDTDYKIDSLLAILDALDVSIHLK